MKKRIVSACALVFMLTAAAWAQKVPVKFGSVPQEDISMKVYDKDTTAAAVVLVDFGESTLVYKQGVGFTIEFERIKRVKILSKDGYEHANITIPLYSSKNDDEKLSGLKAVTYNLEGGKVVETKMKNEAIFKEQLDDNVQLVKLTLPNVKEGSVIEVTYRVYSPFLFNFQDWDFQSTIPTRYSEYRAHIPEYFNYKTYSQGYITWPIQEHETRSDKITLRSYERSENGRQTTPQVDEINFIEHYFRWGVSDVPAFKEEPYMTTYRDFISSINFELAYVQMPNQPIENYSSSWEEITKNFLESDNFGGIVKSSGFLKDEVAALKQNDPTATIGAIYSFVKQNVAWDGTTTKYPSKSLKKVLEEKKGNSADINLLLVAMLQRAELEANPLLISTRDHGFIRVEAPASKQFNYAIAHVQLGDKYLLLDATDRSLPITVIPAKCLNGQGLLVSEKGGWVKLASFAKHRSTITGELLLDREGILTGKLDVSHDGYDAQQARKSYAKEGEANYAKQVAEDFGWESKSAKLQNMDQLSEPVKEQYEVSFNDYVQATGEMIYLNPVLVFRYDENPFKAEKREYPVDFGSTQEKLLSVKIVLGDGVTVEEIPQAKALLLPNRAGKFNYSIMQSGNTLMITNHIAINQAMFNNLEYEGLREFFAQVVAKQAEQIVLKRK